MANLRVVILTLILASMPPIHAGSQKLDAPQTVIVKNGALVLRGLLWHPTGRGPFPVVLFNHGSGSLPDLKNPAILGSTFARHGYAFLFLFRRGAGLSADQGTNSGALMAQAFALNGQEGRNELQLKLQEIELSDVRAGVEFLRTRGDVDARRIAIVGHSFGGQLTLLLTERDSSVRAAVVFGAAAASWDSSPKLQARLIAAVGNTDVPVFFIHAANDYSTAPGTALAAEMKRLGKAQSLKIFPPWGETASQGHNFVNLAVSMWESDVFAFLDERLRP